MGNPPDPELTDIVSDRQPSVPVGTIAVGLAVCLAGSIAIVVETTDLLRVAAVVVWAVMCTIGIGVTMRWTRHRRQWWPLPDAAGARLETVWRWWRTHHPN